MVSISLKSISVVPWLRGVIGGTVGGDINADPSSLSRTSIPYEYNQYHDEYSLISFAPILVSARQEITDDHGTE